MLGIDVRRTIVLVFVMASVLAAISGVLVGPIVTVQPHMGLVFTVKAFAVASLGGFANPLGVLVGAIIFGVVESFSNYVNSAFGDLYPLLLVMALLVIKPSGLFGEAKSRCPLTSLPVRGCGTAPIVAMAAAIFAFPLLVGNTFHIHIAQTLLYTTIAVIGLNMLLGLSGQMSLGQAGFYAIGAYGSALLTAKLGWPIAAGMLAGILLAGLAGCLVGLVALRTRGLYLAMATLAFGFMTEIAAQRWVDLTGGTMGVYGIPALDFGSSTDGQDLLPVGGRVPSTSRCRSPATT